MPSENTLKPQDIFFSPSALPVNPEQRLTIVFRKLHCWTEFSIIQPGMLNTFGYGYCFLDYTENTNTETG